MPNLIKAFDKISNIIKGGKGKGKKTVNPNDLNELNLEGIQIIRFTPELKNIIGKEF